MTSALADITVVQPVHVLPRRVEVAAAVLPDATIGVFSAMLCMLEGVHLLERVVVVDVNVRPAPTQLHLPRSLCGLLAGKEPLWSWRHRHAVSSDQFSPNQPI